MKLQSSQSGRQGIAALPPRCVFAAPDWVLSTAVTLDESHLVAWSRDATRRARFALQLSEQLGLIPDTQVCLMDGCEDAESFARILGAEIGCGPVRPVLDGEDGILEALRHRTPTAEGRHIKRRYYVWMDADEFLVNNPTIFAQLVDAVSGVSAEAEFLSEDPLLLHRAVYVGGPVLDIYAEDDRGQFRCWLREDDPNAEWGIATGVRSPPFKRLFIDDAIGEGDGSPSVRAAV